MANIPVPVRSNLDSVVDSSLGLEFKIPVTDKLAMEVDKDLKNVPEGYAVIVLDYGDQSAYMYPHPVAVGGQTLWIPRASRRAIPMNYLETLLNAKEKALFQTKPGVQGVEYEKNRFNVQILKLPEGKASDFKKRNDSIREKAQRQQIEVQ